MKIDYCSDLHLEFGYQTLPGGEVLILAGDICESRSLVKDFHSTKLLPHVTGSHEHRYYDFFYHECAKYDRVFMVMGNHEHYHGRFDKTLEEIRGVLPENVTLLERDRIDYGGVTFLGATLWTNCNNGDSITMWTLQNSMNDYRVITNKRDDSYGKLRPLTTFSNHIHTVEWLKKEFVEEISNPIVVITHHAPSFQSITEKYRDDKHLNGGYASDLSEFILDYPQIKHWVHGHVHSTHDYVIGDTQILANPRGYHGHEKIASDFEVKSFILDIPEITKEVKGSWE
jgi:hypothetical protein